MKSDEPDYLREQLERAERIIRDLRAENEASFELSGVGRADVIVESGTIARVNKAFCQILGYTAEELCGRRLRDISHAEDAEIFAKAAPHILSGEVRVYATTKRYIHKDGHIIWVAINSSLLPERPGCPRMMTGLVQEITAQRNAEEALHAAAVRFRAIFENSIDAIAVYEGEKHQLVNPAYLKLFGYASEEELAGISGPDLIAESERQVVKERLAQRLRGEHVPSYYISRGLRKDGSEFDLEIHANVFTVGGQAFRLAILRDVTDRVRGQDALRKAHEQLELRVLERTRDLERANRYLLAMKLCAEALAKAGSESELFDSICSIIANTGENRFAWVGVPLDDRAKSIEPVAMKGVELGYLKRGKFSWADVPHGRGPIGRAIRTGRPQVSRNTQTDPTFAIWKEAALQCGYLSMVCLPLVWEEQCLGIVCIYAGVVDAFSKNDLNLLEKFAADLTFGIASLRVRADRERLQKELLENSEKERCRIGQDLHDGLCQELCGIRLFVDRIIKSVPAELDGTDISNRLKQVRDLLQGNLLDTRNIARGLWPAIDTDGLVPAISDLAMNAGQQSGIACKFECSGTGLHFGDSTAMHLFRIAQEAISNAIRHSRAKNLTIRLFTEGSETVLDIADDGAGMDNPGGRNAGMGLRSMAYRADVIGGQLEIASEKSAGTRVTCRLRHGNL
jgi:PAS domain S-box-containing protein